MLSVDRKDTIKETMRKASFYLNMYVSLQQELHLSFIFYFQLGLGWTLKYHPTLSIRNTIQHFKRIITFLTNEDIVSNRELRDKLCVNLITLPLLREFNPINITTFKITFTLPTCRFCLIFEHTRNRNYSYWI